MRHASALLLAAAALALAGPAAARPARAAKPAPRPAAPAAAKAPACDQNCLNALADRYMDAMVARAPAGLPWAKVVRYSENNVPMMIGDGVWATISSHTDTPLRAADPSAGEVVWMGEIQEHGQPAFMALRLKAEDGRIADAEAVVRRFGGPPEYGDPEHYQHDPAFAGGVAAGDRAPKARLAALVGGYFDALEGKPGARTAFDPDCARQENGVVVTAGPAAEGGVTGCAAQIQAGVFKPVAAVRARRYLVVDEARQVVVAAGFFDLPSTAARPADGKGLSWATDYPYSIGFIAAFKIRNGRIYRIDSISDAEPYLMPSPWGGTN